MSAMVVCTMGVPEANMVAETLPAIPAKSLYEQQSALFEEILDVGQDLVPEESLLELPPAPVDLNADNGTPIDVAPSSVHEEVYRYVQYEFTVAYGQCHNATGGESFEVTSAKTSVSQGLDYIVAFNYGGESYSMKVTRNTIGNPKELPSQPLVVRDEFTLQNITPMPCHDMPTWTATEYPQFQGLSIDEFTVQYTGDKAPVAGEFMEADDNVGAADGVDLPTNFDWRDHMGPSAGMVVKEQGQCSSCYAFAAASVATDRAYLASKGRINVDMSPQSLMDCSNGCNGGTASDAFKAMMNNKAAPEWCEPYTGVQSKCGVNRCANATEYTVVPQGNKMATLGIMGRGKETAIMFQLYHYGPVYQRMQVYSDFPYYRSGIYKHQGSAQVRGDHAVKLIGYGQEGVLKYWVAQNSWGEKWGEKGFFRIARGEDESGVESRGVFWAVPDVADTCADAPTCNNGGSFTKDCGCECGDGFSGPTCDVCGASCDGVGFTGALESDKCACECAPGYFDGDVDGVFKKCGLTIGGAAGVEHHIISVPTCVDIEPTCTNWATKGYCTAGSKYQDYTTIHCQKSCELCDTKPSAQIPIMVQGHLAYMYGDMLVAVPTGQKPWNIHRGWAGPAFSAFVCGAESSYEESLFCEDKNAVNIKIATAGAYDVYFFKYLGKNMLGQSKGWDNNPKKLAVGACAGENNCQFAMVTPVLPKQLDDTQQAEVAQRVADASLTAAQMAKAALQAEKTKFAKVEKEAHQKILKAAKLAHDAELQKEAAEMKVKAAQRKREGKELAQKTMDTTAKDTARAKEIDAKRAAESQKSKVADVKRHEVVEAISAHKKVLDRLGEISAQLAEEQAHVDATEKLASKEKHFKVGKAAALQAKDTAEGVQKAAMRKAAKLAKEAAEAQDDAKKDTVQEKVAKQKKLEADQKSKAADKAFEINQKYKVKHDNTAVLHETWTQKSIQAEQNVTTAKEVAVAAMQQAQCIIKDHRSGCKTDGWKGHCQTKKWKAWMMTHCTESCGFSCTDLHDLAMGVVLKAEKKMRKKEKAARKEACPKYNDIAVKYAAYADKYGEMATKDEQDCIMRKEAAACTEMKTYAKMSKDFQKKHEDFKKKMQDLKCYEYNEQWGATGSGAGSAAGKALLRLVESGHKEATPLFAHSQGPSN